MRRLLFGGKDAQRSLAVRAELDAERTLLQNREPQRRERREEERLARRVVRHTEYDVVEHEWSNERLEDRPGVR